MQMTRFFPLLFAVMFLSCRVYTQDTTAIYNDFNAVFTVQSKAGSDPNFSITGTLSNSSGKFAPLYASIDTGDYCLCEYVLGSTRFTATFITNSVVQVSGNKVTLGLYNASGRSVSTFPNGPCSIVRPFANGTLPAANGQSEELRVATMNHNAAVQDTFPKTAYKGDVPAGVDAVTLACIVSADPDSIPSLATRTGNECSMAYDQSENRFFYYDGSRAVGWRWIPLDSLPTIYGPDVSATIVAFIDSLVFKYPDGSAALDIDDGDNSATIYSDNQSSIVRVGDDKTTVTANDIDLQVRGTGEINIKGTSAKAGALEFGEDTDNGSNTVRLKAPDSSPANYILTLPTKNGEVATDGDIASVQSDADDANAAAAAAQADADANALDIADLVTLSGVGVNSTDLGTFTGSTIPDASNNKEAAQALETGLEAVAADVATNTSNISSNSTAIGNLQTLSGVAANATNLGTFTGLTIPDNSTNKAALQSLESKVETLPTSDTNLGNADQNLGGNDRKINLGNGALRVRNLGNASIFYITDTNDSLVWNGTRFIVKGTEVDYNPTTFRVRSSTVTFDNAPAITTLASQASPTKYVTYNTSTKRFEQSDPPASGGDTYVGLSSPSFPVDGTNFFLRRYRHTKLSSEKSIIFFVNGNIADYYDIVLTGGAEGTSWTNWNNGDKVKIVNWNNSGDAHFGLGLLSADASGVIKDGAGASAAIYSTASDYGIYYYYEFPTLSDNLHVSEFTYFAGRLYLTYLGN